MMNRRIAEVRSRIRSARTSQSIRSIGHSLERQEFPLDEPPHGFAQLTGFLRDLEVHGALPLTWWHIRRSR